MKTLSGVSISAGITIAKALVFTKQNNISPYYSIKLSDVPYEINRLVKAIDLTNQELKVLKKKYHPQTDYSAIGLIDVHMMMVNDPDLIAYVTKELPLKLINVEQLLSGYMDKMIAKLSKNNNKLMRERVTDFTDVKHRLTENLSFGYSSQLIAELDAVSDSVALVAQELPSITVMQLKKNQVKAILLQEGGITSHTAIITRTMAVVSIFNIDNLLASVQTGDTLIIDANEGVLFVRPTDQITHQYRQKIKEENAYQDHLNKIILLPAQTIDKKNITLKSNAQKLEDITSGIDQNCDSIGLFRSEFLYLLHSIKEQPTEEQLFNDYCQALTLAQGRVTTIRTLDIGGDKVVKHNSKEGEINPLLGHRALRMCLDHPDIFRTQLRALYRASSFGRLRIMLPFVTGVDDLLEALATMDSVKEQLRREQVSFDETVAVGIMIEIPSAALVSRDLSTHVDFFSIGTNDLTQYSLAVDRTNEKVKRHYQPLHPAVLKLISITLEAARDNNIPCSICGELSADLLVMPLLIGMGVNEFSMSPSRIAMAKELIRQIHYGQAKILASEVLTLKNQKEIICLLKQFKEEHIGTSR